MITEATPLLRSAKCYLQSLLKPIVWDEAIIDVVHLRFAHPPVESRFWLFPVYAVLKLVVCTVETQLFKIVNGMREVTVIINVLFIPLYVVVEITRYNRWFFRNEFLIMTQSCPGPRTILMCW